MFGKVTEWEKTMHPKVDKRYAVIDIGTNSVRLMLAAFDGTVHPQKKEVITTRIGEELDLTGCLGEGGMKRTLQALRVFLASSKSAESVMAFATSAVRDAKNKTEFLRRCEEDLGLRIDVVEGEREAVLGFRGAVGQKEGRLIDIGGGSTELVYGKDGIIHAAYSVPAGCVRAVSRYPHEADFPAVRQWLNTLAKVPFEILSKVDTPVFAVGGTATTLCALSKGLTTYDAAAIEGSILSRQAIMDLDKELGSQTIAQRRRHPLLEMRADIIRYGAALLLECMAGFQTGSVIISDADNLEGYLLENAPSG